mmetsp:Transcript_21958/g.55274  ORF Transcript_21958/g.55274 Transcript_21958/m.55274 type:complete len:239 (-) Transcript_21958:153-869(-)|eukprot:jgi/Tetstr1/426589/TSEL_016867.t1
MALRCRLARLAAGAHGPVAARALGGWGLPGAELPQSAPTHRGFTLLAAVAGWGGPNTADVARGSAASPGLSAGSVQLEGRTQLAAANTLGGLMLRGLSTQAAADFTDYSVIGKIQESFEEPAAPTVFAVVEVGAHQFKVAAGDIITTEKLIGLDVNDKVTLNKVLMLGTAEETVIGRPLIPNAHVVAAVEENFLDAKKTIFKFRRRKNSKTLKGHRQSLTNLRILEVSSAEVEQDVAA